jgi:hypothetical protein
VIGVERKLQMKPRNYVARAQQSGAGRHNSGHAARVREQAKRALVHEVEALEQNELHSNFWGVRNVPVREIRDRLDPQLRAHEIREINNDKD